MNGIHDLGGMDGFGRVEPEVGEPVFHADWEKSVYAMQQSTRILGLFNIDEFRYAIERMEPAHYLEASYYERWLTSIETNLVEKGILQQQDIEARHATLSGSDRLSVPRREDPALTERVLDLRARVAPPPEPERPPRFAAGDPVRVRNDHPHGHTRVPRYVRGKLGQIARVHGIQTFPDSNAQGQGKHPQAVYSVRFAGSELWGDSAEPNQILYIDLWDSYLDPA